MNKKYIQFWVGLIACGILWGCGGGKLSDSAEDQSDSQPAAGAQNQSQGLGSDAPTDQNPLPLKLDGLSSVAELQQGLKGTTDEEAKSVFESGFRKTFTADQAKRDYPGAVEDLSRAVELDPDFAEAYRALGYARFNMGFDVDGAMTNYNKAIELKPDYGEVHYALAFMYAMGDREKGAEHFWKAMELGIPDERGLADRFYAESKP